MEIQTIKLRLNRRYPENLPKERSQAERIIEKFGGAYKMAATLGARPSTVYRWTYPKEKGGCGGLVPSTAMPKILALARREGVFLTGDDLYPGRK